MRRVRGLTDGSVGANIALIMNRDPAVVDLLVANDIRFVTTSAGDPALFTESEHWREFLRKDPLALHEASARMLFQSNSLDIYLRRADMDDYIAARALLQTLQRHITKVHTRKIRRH